MRAVVMQGLHKPLAVETLPDPTPGDGEVVAGEAGFALRIVRRIDEYLLRWIVFSIRIGGTIGKTGKAAIHHAAKYVRMNVFRQRFRRIEALSMINVMFTII